MVKTKFEYKGNEEEIDVDGIFSAAVIDDVVKIVIMADGKFNKFVAMDALAGLVINTIDKLYEANPYDGDKFIMLHTFLRLLSEKGERK